MTADKRDVQNPLDRLTGGGWAKGLIRLAVGIALVAVVLRVAGGDSWRHLRDPALLPVVAFGAVVHLVQRCARIKKWQLMIAPTNVRQRSFMFLMRIQLIGMMANLALPVSEAVKVWAVSKDRDDAKVSAKSIVVDMAMHTALVGAVGAICLFVMKWFHPVLWAVAVVMMTLPLVVIVVARRFPAPPPEGGAIADSRPVLWALAAVETTCQISLYAMAFKAIDVPASTLEVMALAPVLYIVDLLNFTPSGLGLREGLFAGVAEVMPNVSTDVAVAAGLVLSSMLLLATVAGGGLALLIPAPSDDP